MINTSQLSSLTEEELSYLLYCCKNAWDSHNIGYEFKVNFTKSFKNNSIQGILYKYKHILKPEYDNLPNQILEKLENNS